MPAPETTEKIAEYFYKKTKELIEQNSFSLIHSNTCSVNIVRDVLRYVPVHWTASEIVSCRLDKTWD